MNEDLLIRAARTLLFYETWLAVVLTLLVLFFGAVSSRRLRRRNARLTEGRDAIATALGAGHVTEQHLASIRRIPVPTVDALVLEFGQSLKGSGLERLAELGNALGVAPRAEALCQSRWWPRRLRGARLLTALNVDSLSMRTLLHDADHRVRAQAFVWAAGRVDEDVIASLVAHLVDREELCRFTVQDSLLRLGRPAAAALGKFLSASKGEGLEEGLSVARGLAQPELMTPVLALCRHENDAVRARATEVLGTLGGEEAVAMLCERLSDTAPAVRAAAAQGTGEVGYWQAAPDVARLLGDRSYPVRRESALALRRMGGVGLLTLRRARDHENPFAADMARQVLDLPESVYNRVAG